MIIQMFNEIVEDPINLGFLIAIGILLVLGIKLYGMYKRKCIDIYFSETYYFFKIYFIYAFSTLMLSYTFILTIEDIENQIYSFEVLLPIVWIFITYGMIKYFLNRFFEINWKIAIVQKYKNKVVPLLFLLSMFVCFTALTIYTVYILIDQIDNKDIVIPLTIALIFSLGFVVLLIYLLYEFLTGKVKYKVFLRTDKNSEPGDFVNIVRIPNDD